jgi:hypothetical protein
MTTTRILLVVAVLAAVAVAPAAHAQGPGGPPPGMGTSFGGADPTSDPLVRSSSAWDANRDGMLTCDEWRQFVTRLFNAADTNRDGFLDAAEFAALKRSSPVFGQADLGYFDDNRDGRLSRAEFVDKKSPMFARYDRNGDCRITPEELRGGGSKASGGRGVRPTLGTGGMGGKVDF